MSSDQVNVEGEISANGGPPNVNVSNEITVPGAGSGGSVLIIINQINGQGNITANGGDSLVNCSGGEGKSRM